MAEKQQQRPSFRDRLRSLTDKYRLILLQEKTYDERFAINTNPLQLLLLVLAAAFILILITTVLFMYTPLKNTIPGYVDDEWKRDARYSRQQVDSLLREVEERDRYLNNIKLLLSGNVVPDSTLEVAARDSFDVEEEDLPPYEAAPEDSALRAKVTNEDRYLLSVTQQEEQLGDPSRLYLFQPLSGMMSAPFDPRISHYGIDIVAPANSVIKSVLGGTVVFASWTSGGGYELHLQHPYNLISVYKHNSVLLKSLGDQVEPGDAIAIIGDSGDHSDGPHLHFELWRSGVPVDPSQYFVFEE